MKRAGAKVGKRFDGYARRRRDVAVIVSKRSHILKIRGTDSWARVASPLDAH